MKTGWENWGYSAWTKEEYRSTLQQLEKDFLQVIRQEGMTFNWRRVDIPWGWRSTSGPNKLWMPHPRKCSRPGLMELGAIWWYMGVPAHGMGLELGNLVGFFQLKPFYDSMMIFFVLLWNVFKLLSWTRAVKSTQVMCQICFYLEAKKPPNILSCFFFFFPEYLFWFYPTFLFAYFFDCSAYLTNDINKLQVTTPSSHSWIAVASSDFSLRYDLHTFS